MNEIYINPVDESGQLKDPEACFLEAAEKFAADKKRKILQKEIREVAKIESEDVLPREDSASKAQRVSSGVISVVRPLTSGNAIGSVKKLPAGLALALMGKQASENPFSRTDTNPDVLGNMLIQKYQKSWLEWEPETLWKTIETDFGQLSDSSKEEINAVKLLLLTDSFWNEYHIFEKCIIALNGEQPDFGVMQPPSPAQLAFGVAMARKIRDNIAFSEEVISYIRAVMIDNGFTVYPTELDFAQPFVTDEVKQMKETWNELHLKTPEFILDPLEEDAVGVLFARLNSVKAYMDVRMTKETA